MGVLHFWSPWLTHSNRFLKWHSYFNTIVFIYSCKITLNHSSKKNVARGQNVGAVQLDLPVWGKKIHIFMWNQTSKEQILDVNSVQFTIFIKSSQYCSKSNPNLASKKKKNTVNPRLFYSTATRKKCRRTQRDLSQSFTLLTVLSQHFHTQECELRTTETQTPVWPQDVRKEAGRKRRCR